MRLDLMAEGRSGERKHRAALHSLVRETEGTVRIASAYVTDTQLLSGIKNRDVRLLTHLTKMDIITGASSLDSLAELIKAGVRCRYVSDGPRLHAKVYVFNDLSAVVTSANLTRNALDRNIEVGIHLSGALAHRLVGWFDTLWTRSAHELNLATVSKWHRETEAQRAEYSALRKKIEKQSLLPSESLVPAGSGKRLRELFETTSRFFVCNTDRKWYPDGEERMRHRAYAAAWEDFRYPSHMDKVRRGDGIFMFAKGVGIVGVGRAKGQRQVLKPGDPSRIRLGTKPEWRVPVEWLAWKGDRFSFSCTSPNITFFDVSGDKYRQLRRGVRKRFETSQ